jgi:hypothetical protein
MTIFYANDDAEDQAMRNRSPIKYTGSFRRDSAWPKQPMVNGPECLSKIKMETGLTPKKD